MRGWLLPIGALIGCVVVLAMIPFARGADLVAVLAKLAACLVLLFLVILSRRLWPSTLERWRESCEALCQRLERSLAPGRCGILLAAGMLAYAAFWSVLSILRHEALNSSGFDLAIQHQVLWNLAHGRSYESSIEVSNYLGDHVALTLPFIAPLLWIWDDVRILLIAQSCVLALGALPVARLARRRCGSRLEGLLWPMLYLLTPAVGFMNKYDFHDLVVALPLLLAAIDALDEGRMGWASVWMLLSAATREEVGLAVAGIGLWAAVAQRRRLWGIGWCAAGLVWAVVALYAVIPHFRGGVGSDTLARYGWLGGSPGEILKTLFTHPWSLFESQYHRVRRVVFPLQLLWPMAGLPVLSLGRLAVVLPNLGLSLTSSAISQQSIYFQYNAPILPFLFWAGIEGHARLLRGGASRAVLALCLLFALAGANIADPAAIKSVGRPYTIVDGIRPRANRGALREAARLVPADASLLASNDLAPHFSARRLLAVAHTRKPNPETAWIILDVTDTRHLESREDVARLIRAWVVEGDYAVAFFRDGILVLGREAREDPAARDALRGYLAEFDLDQP